MALTRKTKFGMPPGPAASGSAYTSRLVPLTQGARADLPFTDRPAGSAISVSNLLPLDGALRPRSRLSSLGTVFPPVPITSVSGMAALWSTKAGVTPKIWYSGGTRHGLVLSGGSISVASFVSANGAGTAPTSTAQDCHYAQSFSANIDENMLVVAGSSSLTLMCLYQVNGSSSGQAVYSYLTGAPKAAAVGAYDNYLIAFNITAPGAYTSRVQWCQRGDPFNWTGEGSGFEDLLEMKGSGRAVFPLPGRVMLFSDREIWQGVSATYPAQFEFIAYDTHVGVDGPRTIQDTEFGLVFYGSDRAVHLVPRDGGPLIDVAPTLTPVLRKLGHSFVLTTVIYGVYDSNTKLYYFTMVMATGQIKSFVINIQTGEWGHNTLGLNLLAGNGGAALGVRTQTYFTSGEDMYFVGSNGTVYSLDSRASTDFGSVVTSTWRSAPIGTDLPANYKQLIQVDLDYRADSAATLILKVSQDGGNNYDYTAQTLSLASAPFGARATSQMYVGGAYPSLEITSTSTGYQLNRIDTTLMLGGRR